MPYNSPWLVDQASVKFLTILKILETKLSSRNFSQKMNERICFSILAIRKYLKLEFQFQASSISESSG